MAVRSTSHENISSYDDNDYYDYRRQTTANDPPIVYRESRALVRRPSVDLAKLTKQNSRVIIDSYFRKPDAPPVHSHISAAMRNKISDTELGKVLTMQFITTPTSGYRLDLFRVTVCHTALISVVH